MMLYLTGAASSSKMNVAPQEDAAKSLGGFISSSPVPNASVNTLFDLISIKTLQERNKETIAIGLVNKLDCDVHDVTLKMVSGQDNICNFKIAACDVDDDLCFEHIANRYAEPLTAEFYDATFYRGSVDVEILMPAEKGEQILFHPFDITADVLEGGIEGTYAAIQKAFGKDEEYAVRRLTETKFRIERTDDMTIEKPFHVHIHSNKAQFETSGRFRNVKGNELLLTEVLEQEKGIGIWIQREISDVAEKSDEELLQDYIDKREIEKLEEVELVINYNLAES